jgi:2-polyprenyl-3-methyl-5-hydroxy-6-metoxy-1,4-benzoquinol methylase
LISKIQDIYGKNNVYAIQPLDAEYSDMNTQVKTMLMEDHFIEMSLEDYIKTDHISFDIILIYKWNISVNNKDDFIMALSRILNPGGIIYVTSVEKARLYYNPEYHMMYIVDKCREYFTCKIKNEFVDNLPYEDGYHYGSLQLELYKS